MTRSPEKEGTLHIPSAHAQLLESGRVLPARRAGENRAQYRARVFGEKQR